MSASLSPVVSDVADLFTWKTVQTLTTNVVGTTGQFATDQVKILDNSFFVFVAFRGVTNYDPVTELRAVIGAGPAAATGLYPAAVPNNFEVLVKRNNRYSLMDQPMPQAALCSTGYRAGQQVPFPIIYPPRTTFNFWIYNTAPVLLKAADQTTAINLRVDFGLCGYNVLTSNLPIFVNQWPALYGKAIQYITGMNTTPGM